MLTCTNIVSGYGKLHILEGISLQASNGRIAVVVGPNGSGKSTLLKSISGLATIFEGSVKLDGEELSDKAAPEIARKGIAYLPQTDNVFTDLSVKENLRLAGYLVAKSDYEERVKGCLNLFPQLSHYLHTKAANLSGGERQMLAISMALIRRPTVMMFDEPTANLAPKIANHILETISSITKDLKLTTLLVEQNARLALQIGDDATLMVSGRKVFSGSCDELLRHQELGRLYLGLKVDAMQGIDNHDGEKN